MNKKALYLLTLTCIMFGCSSESNSQQASKIKTPGGQDLTLPAPEKGSVKFSKVTGWPAGKTPVVPAGFVVTRFAENIKSPRNMIVGPYGEVFVVLSNSERTAKEKIVDAVSGKAKSEVPGESANTILVYKDLDKDGIPETASVFLSGLNQPYGMAIIGDWFFVANTDGLWRFPFQPKESKITGPGSRIVNLPAGGYNNHWTRNLITNADKTKIYISVGSATNVADKGMEVEKRRANILEVNPDGSGERIFASGLRNPVGMDWAPVTNMLWTAVNERDGLGDDLVPDYITSVKPGAFYGWPFSYFGQNEDPRLKGQNPELVKKAIVPDIPMGSHTASLGLAFYKGNKFPQKYQGGAFVGQHGSWNRSAIVGYKVVYVPFRNGKPTGKPEDFMTGFIADADKGEVYGRPVGVTVMKDGSMLVADDASGIIWRVTAK